MRKCLIFIVLSNFISSQAQLYDKNWVVGEQASIISFEDTTYRMDSFQHFVVPYLSWASISDAQGDFQFFTTGTKVYDRNGDLILHGDSMCSNRMYSYMNGKGLPDNQSCLIFPINDSLYRIIQEDVTDSNFIINSTPTYPDRLVYAIVNMKGNNGLGEVISKKNILYDGAISETHLTACKHANGRDYWLVCNKHESNEYIKFLVTPDSIWGPYFQVIGSNNLEPDGRGQLAFSPNGERFASITAGSELNFMEFDRCSGTFFNNHHFPIPKDTAYYQGQTQIVGGGGIGIAFSPSGRYLYVGVLQNIAQYDLLGTGITGDFTYIWRWDSVYGFTYTEEIYAMPNGKILISNWAGLGSHGYHIIEHPDSAGVACKFTWNAIHPYTTNNFAINNTFNYRLGKLVGSGCDTINSIMNDVLGIMDVRVFPNPASSKLTVALSPSFRARNEREISILFTNLLGERIHEEILTQAEQEIDVSGWAKGVYFVTFKAQGAVIGTRKVVIE